MKEDALLELFYDYLTYDKRVSSNTFQAYKSDLSYYSTFLLDISISDVKADSSHIESFKEYMKSDGKAVSSVSRALSSVRSYYSFLQKNGIIDNNPAKSVKNDKCEEKTFDVLSADEIDTLINQPSGNDEKSVRDRAILELMYATGLKVSELISLNVADFNPTLGFIRCCAANGEKERIIPLYAKIKKLLNQYLLKSRTFLVSSESENALFVNINGARMTRQGLWKILKQYAQMAGIKKDINPCTLRNSFATHLLENGADVAQLKDILGHSEISSTNQYVNFLKKKTNGSLILLHPHA